MVKVHRLTEKGIARFIEFIDSQRTTEPESFDIEVVNSSSLSTQVDSDFEVSLTCDLETRFDFAEVLSTIVDGAEISDPEHDRGFWCWISWLWFESICPTDKHGRRLPGEIGRWVLNLDYKRYYRHLLAGPWWIYRSHIEDPERARALLCTRISTLGELAAQIASRQELVSNPGLVEMLTQLFFDPATQKLRRGIAGKGKGSARRLAKVLDQLDMIWDLYSTTADEFAQLMPAEFDKYK